MTAEAQTFNTPLEAGVRALFLLTASPRRSFDLDRLIQLDYAMVHTGLFDGPESMHPATPSQGSQLLVRRAVLQEGLELMRSRDLVFRHLRASGIVYQATVVGGHVTREFASAYAEELRERASWVSTHLATRSDRELRDLFGAQTRAQGIDLVSTEVAGDESWVTGE